MGFSLIFATALPISQLRLQALLAWGGGGLAIFAGGGMVWVGRMLVGIINRTLKHQEGT